MRIGSLFSGAGGLDLAVEEVFGGETIWHSEIDKAASKVLAYRWPGVPNLGSITEIDWASVEPVDVLCGGFPCQDVSAAGKRAGIKDGTRSGLWAVFAEAIDALRPQYVVIENVRGLLSAAAHRTVEDNAGDYLEPDPAGMGDGAGRPVLRAAGAVLGDLADLGYDSVWATVAAADVGAPHRRERVFILATAAHAGYRGQSEWAWQAGRETGERFSVGHVAGCGGEDAAVSGDEPGVALLPTPVVTDAMGARNSTAWRSNPDHGISIGDTLTDAMWKLAAERGEMELPTGPTRGGGDEPGVALLPTPNAQDGNGGKSPRGGRDTHNTGTKRQVPLTDLPDLLPTPNASDASGGDQHPDEREGHSRQLIDYVLLLQTPQARDGKGLPGDGFNKGNLLSQVIDAADGCCHPADARLICDSDINCGVCSCRLSVGDAEQSYRTHWGKYEPAIRRWEQIVGPAPAPTEPNKNGNPRLSAAFSEWLMGWPAGWVTDPAIGISRNDQLRIVGNGVCPQQAAAALRYLLTITRRECNGGH